MVRYKYSNGTPYVPNQLPAHHNTLTPAANKPTLFVVEVNTGMQGPESYHKSLMRGLLTLVNVQEKYKIIHGANDGRDITNVISFLKELLKDDEYEAIQQASHLNELKDEQ